MPPRRLALPLATMALTLAVTSIDDVRMPDALREHPGPELTSCSGEGGGLAPMHYRLTYADGASSEWLPLQPPPTPSHGLRTVSARADVVSRSVRDGLGRTATVDC